MTRRLSRTEQIASVSVMVGCVVLVLKLGAWAMTGSVAIFSDALESIVNVATAIAALVAIRVAARPPDAQHPYGHHKAEFLSAVFEGVLIVIAALMILREAWLRLLEPLPLEAPWIGLGVTLVASLLNAAWALFLLRQGRSRKSPALAADGRHLMTDVVSSLGVVAGVAAAAVTGWLWLDPALAALVAVHILISGWRVISASVSGLLDESVPGPDLEAVRTVISRHADGAVEAHDLRTRQAGRATFVEFHLVVPGDMSVNAAHDICDRIETGLKEEMTECSVTIHVEPEHKAKHEGIVVL